MPRPPPSARRVVAEDGAAVGRGQGDDRRPVDRERVRAARAGVAGAVRLRRLRGVRAVGRAQGFALTVYAPVPPSRVVFSV